MENQTPKHFVLQLGSLISLYLTLGFLLSLLFGVINLKFPDATEGYWAIESGTQAVRLGHRHGYCVLPNLYSFDTFSK